MLASVLTSPWNILFLCYGFQDALGQSSVDSPYAFGSNSNFLEDLEFLCPMLQVNAVGNKSFCLLSF